MAREEEEIENMVGQYESDLKKERIAKIAEEITEEDIAPCHEVDDFDRARDYFAVNGWHPTLRY